MLFLSIENSRKYQNCTVTMRSVSLLWIIHEIILFTWNFSPLNIHITGIFIHDALNYHRWFPLHCKFLFGDNLIKKSDERGSRRWNRIKETYVNFDAGVEEESFSCRMFERSVSVELEDTSIPLDTIQWYVVHLVAAMQLCALSSSNNFRINRESEILQSFTRICNKRRQVKSFI